MFANTGKSLTMANANALSVDVLIQGGGIGGLLLAHILHGRGYRVKVLEKAPGPTEVGAGIWVAQNAMQILEKFGMNNRIKEVGWPLIRHDLSDVDGTRLQSLNLERYNKIFNVELVAVHRARLHQILLDSLPIDIIAFGTTSEKIVSEQDRVSIQDNHKRTWNALILVGADGIHSEIRKTLFPNSVIRFSGSSSYRGIVKSKIKANRKSYEIWAPGCRLGFSYISHDEIYWFLTFDADADVRNSATENYAHALSIFEKHFPMHLNLIVDMQPDQLIRTDITDLKPLETWFKGRVVLMGDAAHATTPNLGQGGAQAIEDAYVLGTELGLYGLSEEALRSFFIKRKSKALWITNASQKLGMLCHIKNPIARSIRNSMMKLTPGFVLHRQMLRTLSISEST